MFVIIRHNEATGHRYVYTDGNNDMTFKDLTAASVEIQRIKKLGGTHAAKAYGVFRNTRQARHYCQCRGQGMDEAAALEAAIC